jgi:hypothetical protein
MPELNVLTAIPFAAFAAAVWAIVAVRMLLRSGAFSQFSQNQRLAVWGFTAIAFLPSLFIGFLGAGALLNVTVHPGPWVGFVFALTVALGTGVLGAALTWIAAWLAAFVIRGASRANKRAA